MKSFTPLMLFFAALMSMAMPAQAGIVKIQGEQSCNVDGLDTDTSSVRGGVHCDSGSPFSLSSILDGTIGLLVGDSQTPSWNVINDTGSFVDTISLGFTRSKRLHRPAGQRRFLRNVHDG